MNKSFFMAMCMAGQLHAMPLDYGNVAPIEARTELRVNGTSIGDTGYLQFGQVEVNSGTLTVEAYSADTGALLTSAIFQLAPEPGVVPIVLLQGNGVLEPFAVALYQGVLSESGSHAGDAREMVHIAHHHVALVPGVAGAGGSMEVETQQWCSGKVPGRFRMGGTLGSLDWYYGAMRGVTLPTDIDYAEKECGLLVQGDFGSVRLAVPYDIASDTRFIFAGDGSGGFPYTLTAVRDGGRVVATSGLSEPIAGAVMRSPHIWYDLLRPAQSVALYPIAGSDALVAYWFAHDESGNSRWYFLDGSVTGVGQYELNVLQATGDAAKPATEAGFAHLNFVDCNNAEVRVILKDGSSQTLRLRRSIPVLDCDVGGD